MLLHVIHAVIYASEFAVLWYAWKLVRTIIPIPPLSMLFSRAHKEEMKVRVVVHGSGSEQWAEVITDDTAECAIANDWSDRFRSHCIENGLDMNEYSPYTIHKDTW